MDPSTFSPGKIISYISKDVHNYHKMHLKEFDMGWGQLRIVLLLLHNDGLNQEAISSCLEIDKTTVTRTLKKLETSGFIERRTDPKDKRIHRVYLTEKSMKHKDYLVELRQHINDQLLEGFTDEEILLLIDFMHRLKHNSQLLLEEKI